MAWFRKNRSVVSTAPSAKPATNPAPSTSAKDTQSLLSESQQAALRVLEGVARYGVTSRDTIDKVVRLARGSDHMLRRASISALVQISGPSGYLTLIELLNDPNPSIQGEAAEALGTLGIDQAIEPLKDLLSRDDGNVALRAAVALARLKDSSGRALAIRRVREDGPHAGLAAFALGLIEGCRFRPNRGGVEEARRYLKRRKIK